MNKYFVKPFKKKVVNLELELPGSKSITNRCFVISALASGETVLRNPLLSDDTIYMMKVLKELGIRIELIGDNEAVRVFGGQIPRGNKEFFVGNAGTTMRFLTSYLSLGDGHFLLDGDERMRQRPIKELVDALRLLGVDVYCVNGNGCPPVMINARGVKGGKAVIGGKNSSQYISSILMASPYFYDGVELSVEEELVSLPYILMTMEVMKSFGVQVDHSEFRVFRVNSGFYSSPGEYYVEPDASTASYFLAGAAILSGRVKIYGLGRDSIQGDVGFAFVLEKMGCKVRLERDYIELLSDGNLEGIDIDMNKMPDLVPTLAVVGLFAKTPTTIRNVYNLRIKESDRISAIAREISKLGGEVLEFEDGLKIFPLSKHRSVTISTYNDHRIAMAFTIAGLKLDGIAIENPSCVTKSFPEFYDYIERYFGQ